MEGGSGELTMDELRARIRAANVTITEARLAMVRRLLGDALVPLRTVDPRAIRTVEPAVTFDPAAPQTSSESGDE